MRNKVVIRVDKRKIIQWVKESSLTPIEDSWETSKESYYSRYWTTSYEYTYSLKTVEGVEVKISKYVDNGDVGISTILLTTKKTIKQCKKLFKLLNENNFEPSWETSQNNVKKNTTIERLDENLFYSEDYDRISALIDEIEKENEHDET